MGKMKKIRREFREVTKELNEFAQEFCPFVKCKLARTFCANVNKFRIYYAIAESERGVDLFYKNFVARYPKCKDFDPFTLSFFHELGHIVTRDKMVDDADERTLLAACEADDEEANARYFDLYNERLATDWAGKFLTRNREAMRIWEARVLRKLAKAWKRFN